MVDLTLIKRLVGELESSLNVADQHLKSNNRNDYIVDMAKSTGMAYAIMSEAYLLIADINKDSLGQFVQASGKDDAMSMLLNLTKKMKPEPENN